MLIAVLALMGSAPEPDVPPAAIELEWNAPPGCSSAAEIQDRIVDLLSGPPRGEGTAYVTADVVAVGDGMRMTLTTTLAESTDVREVTSTRCDALADATAMLLAVALEPGLAPVLPAPEPEARVRPEPAAEPEPTRDPPVVPVPVAPELPPRADDDVPATASPPRPAGEVVVPRRSSAGLRAFAAADSGAEWGALGGPTAAFRVSVGMARRAWLAEFVGTYFVPRRTPDALLQAGTFGVRGCWIPGRSTVRPLVCAGADAGGFRVASRGLDPPVREVGPYAGPVVALGGAWQRARVGFIVRAEGMARAWGSRIVRDDEVLLLQRSISVRILAGVRIALGRTQPSSTFP